MLAASRPRRRRASPSRGSAIACPKAPSSASCRAAPSRRSRSISACCMRSRELGVTVWNDARAIERCVDKSTTTFFLQRDGVADAAHLRLRRPRRRRRRSPHAARRRQEARAEAAVRRARQGLAPDRLARRSRPARGGEWGLLSPGVRPPAQAHHQDWRIFVCQGARRRLDDQARLELDHQYQAGRARQGGDRRARS